MGFEVYEMLLKRKKDAGYVFLDTDGQPFNNQRLKLRLAHTCKRAGLRHIGWHTLRHTFASHLVMNGVHLSVVQKLMGHSTITTTTRYTHLSPAMLREAISTLNTKDAVSVSFGQPVGNQKTSIAEKPYTH